MSRFVTVDNATYFSTPDLNWFSADTCSIQQSDGGWYEHRNSSISTVASDEASYGDNILRWTVVASAADSVAGTQGDASGSTGGFDGTVACRPKRPGWRPVIRDARVGVHTGQT